MVLLNLDSETMLLSQRTCKDWEMAINNSRSIQKKLFFIECTFEEAVWLGMVSTESLIDVCDYRDDDDDKEALYHSVINTHILKHVRSVRADSNFSNALKLSEKSLPDMISACRGKSSWERMLLTQPPWYTFVDAQYPIDTDPKRPYETSELDFGEFKILLTLRDVMDKVELDVMHKHNFAISWRDASFELGGEIMRWSNGESEAFTTDDLESLVVEDAWCG